MPIESSSSVIHVARSFLNPDFQGHQVGTVRVSSIMHVWSQKSACNLMRSSARLELPDQYNLVDHFVDRHIREGRGDKTAIISGERRLTYGEIAAQVNCAGNGLLKLGLQEEQRVLLVLPDTPEFAAAYFGTMKIGAVAVPTSTALRASDYAYFLEESRARIAIVHSTLLAEFGPALSGQRYCKHVIVCGEPVDDHIHWNQFLKDASPEIGGCADEQGRRRLLALDVRQHGPAESRRAHAPRLGLLLRVLRARRVGHPGRRCHVLLVQTLSRLWSWQRPDVPISRGRHDDPVPRQATSKNDSGHRAGESADALLFGADALCGDATGGRARTAYDLGSGPFGSFGRRAFARGYFSPLEGAFRRGDSGRHRIDRSVAYLSFGAGGQVRAGSTGQAVPGYELALVDHAGQPVPPGAIGDLMVAGPSTAQCYWNRRDLTQDRMRGRWFFTGDKYTVDEDGYYWYAGRSDDMFRVSGQWVSPIEVESTLIEHRCVLEAAVIAFEEETGLHTPKAFVVLREGYAGSADLVRELQDFVKQRITPYKYPRRIEFLAELPKTAAGKVLRYKLREMSRAAVPQATGSVTDPRGMPGGGARSPVRTGRSPILPHLGIKSMEPVNYRIEGRIAILTVENPPVNALSVTVQEGLREAIARAVLDSDVDAAVIAGAGNTFIAGADIRQLERMARDGVVQSILPQILIEIEAAPKPFVAAIHGNAFGGGLEVALASHYRIASAESRIGQPEVKLGIIPGAGGTQRLPRLAGVEAALEMCVFGEPAGAEDARRLGIIDRIAEKDLLACAIQFAEEVSRHGPRRTRDLAEKLGTRESNAAIFAAYRERVRKIRRNLLAPAAAVDAIEASTDLPFEEGCRKEREIFKRLLVSSQAQALIHVFFAERAAGKIPGADKISAVFPIRAAAVVGAGTMGRGIAMCFANAGIPVLLKDAKREALEAAMKSIESIYQGSVGKGRISADEMRQPAIDDPTAI